MPTYVYKCNNESCEKHGENFDVVQSIKDDSLKDCPFCKLPHIQKVIQAGNFVLTGTGWYSKGNH